MSKELNAVALANKRLRAENMKLWAQNEELERGCEEQKLMYEALVTQLVMLHEVGTGDPTIKAYELTLPKVNVGELMEKYRLEAKHTDDGLFLRVVKND